MAGQYDTAMSQSNLDHIQDRSLTPAQLIDFLESGALYRSFRDVLQEAAPEGDLAEKLRQRLPGIEGQPPTPKEAEAVRRNISNWLSGSAVPQSREQLFKICFALELDEARASRVLAWASETGIHYRNPKELVYAYALRVGLDYAGAVALDREMRQIYQPVVDAAEAERKAAWKQKEEAYHRKRAEARRRRSQRAKQGGWAEPYLGALEQEAPPPAFLAQQVARRFETVTDRESLRRFFMEASGDLGVIHESAYEKFWRLLMMLQEPDDVIAPTRGREAAREGGEKDTGFYSLERIARLYFQMHVPVGKKTGSFDCLQKTIKKNWPGATELQKMKSRRVDVSRKALLLLFLITEDFLYSEDLRYSDCWSEAAALFLPGEEGSPRDQLEAALRKVNLFLETYGMNQLDPGSPFDCLVLYALAAEYDTEFLSDKFSSALEALFSRGMEPG